MVAVKLLAEPGRKLLGLLLEIEREAEGEESRRKPIGYQSNLLAMELQRFDTIFRAEMGQGNLFLAAEERSRLQWQIVLECSFLLSLVK